MPGGEDHREATLLLRAEVNAFTALLMKKGVFSVAEFQSQLMDEVEFLHREYEKRFPGMKATEYGIEYDLARVDETIRHWRP